MLGTTKGKHTLLEDRQGMTEESYGGLLESEQWMQILRWEAKSFDIENGSVSICARSFTFEPFVEFFQVERRENMARKKNALRIPWMKMKKAEVRCAIARGEGAMESIAVGIKHSREEGQGSMITLAGERCLGAGMNGREEKETKMAIEELWSGALNAVESLRENFVRAVSDGIAGMAGAGVLGMQQGKRGDCVQFASMSTAMAVGDGTRRGGGGVDNVGEEGRGLATRVPYLPKRGTYAYDVLLRRFNEHDQDGTGFISEEELKVALKELNLPASEDDVQSFMDQIADTTQITKVTFEQFSEYAVQREDELLDTFKELDKRKIGYITEDEMKAAVRKYKFRLKDKEVSKMVNRMHIVGGMKGATQFFSQGKTLDFAEYRDFLMFATAKDLPDIDIWGPAVIDLGDVDTSFPKSIDKYSRQSKVRQEGPKQQVLKHLFAGGISAAVSRTVVAPLERVKVQSMVNKDVAKTVFTATLSKIWREEGVPGLFRGNNLNVIRIAPTKAVEFFVYDNLKAAFLRRTKKADISGLEQMLLGSIASVMGTFVTHPLDTVRSVVTGQNGKKGMVEVTKAIVDSKGLLGLYSGLGPNMVRVAPYGAINFFVYNQLQQWSYEKTGPRGEQGAIPTLIFGALAGASAQTAAYPLEMVRRRLQVQASKQGPVLYKNMVDAFQIIVREEGAGALYAGLVASYLKLVPAAAISFLVYEAIKKQLDLN